MAEGDRRVVLIAVDASKQADEAFDCKFFCHFPCVFCCLIFEPKLRKIEHVCHFAILQW
jgi:hypothetical protein